MSRVYNGSWNNEDINNSLKVIEELNTLSKKEQLFLFMKRTGKSRSSFFKYKSFLKGKRDTIANNKYQKYLDKGCYFCGKENSLCIHHINFKKDDRKENLLTICPSCHNKIHLLFKRYLQV